MPSPRTNLVDLALNWRIIRAVMAYLPDSVRPPVPTWGAAVKVRDMVVNSCTVHTFVSSLLNPIPLIAVDACNHPMLSTFTWLV